MFVDRNAAQGNQGKLLGISETFWPILDFFLGRTAVIADNKFPRKLPFSGRIPGYRTTDGRDGARG
jgi:hypothetical protein